MFVAIVVWLFLLVILCCCFELDMVVREGALIALGLQYFVSLIVSGGASFVIIGFNFFSCFDVVVPF